MVTGGYGGYKRLQGGSDDFSLQTNRHFIIIYISSDGGVEIMPPCTKFDSDNDTENDIANTMILILK